MGSRRRELLLRIGRILENVTPLSVDCGELCGARCCKGGDHDGMWLLPGEELLLGDEAFLTIRETKDGYYAVCEGSCERTKRPIACRLYPCFPVLSRGRTGKHHVKTVPDLRALSSCALFHESAPAISPAFRHAVRRAGILMLRDRKLRAWLRNGSDYLSDIAKLRSMLED